MTSLFSILIWFDWSICIRETTLLPWCTFVLKLSKLSAYSVLSSTILCYIRICTVRVWSELRRRVLRDIRSLANIGILSIHNLLTTVTDPRHSSPKEEDVGNFLSKLLLLNPSEALTESQRYYTCSVYTPLAIPDLFIRQIIETSLPINKLRTLNHYPYGLELRISEAITWIIPTVISGSTTFLGLSPYVFHLLGALQCGTTFLAVKTAGMTTQRRFWSSVSVSVPNCPTQTSWWNKLLRASSCPTCCHL